MRLNEKTSTATRNLAGGHAHDWQDPKEALRSVTINNLLENTYYETDQESLDKLFERFKDAVAKDAEFPLKLAAYTRQEMWVRDVPQVLLVFAAYDGEASQYVTRYAPMVIDRVDELATCLAFSNIYRNGAPDDFSGDHPSVLISALSDVIESGKFDEYQYAKYKGLDDAVSLHDVLNVARPFDEHVEWAERITKGYKDDHPDVEPLRQRRTWEDELSERGNTLEVWQDVLKDMGIMARMRNLRNMLEAGVPSNAIVSDITDEWIQNSKMYPFRFYQARKALKRAGLMDQDIHEFLEHAIDVSATSIPEELEYTAALVDCSGSMTHPLSGNSDLTMKEISALFGAMMTVNGAPSLAFAEQCSVVTHDPLSPSILSTQEEIMRQNVGGSTFAHEAIKEVLTWDDLPDRVVVFTDFQIWESSRYGNNPNAFRGAWEELRSKHPEEPHLYIVDLASYGEIKLPEGYPNVHRLQGWNSRVLDYIWHSENSMLEDIESYGH